jgi:hypothetical protein
VGPEGRESAKGERGRAACNRGGEGGKIGIGRFSKKKNKCGAVLGKERKRTSEQERTRLVMQNEIADRKGSESSTIHDQRQERKKIITSNLVQLN